MVAAQAPTRHQRTVLIAEDYADTREMYLYYLASRGWRVVEAEHGGQVAALVAEHHPDVIVMDLSMPEVDGWELTRRLKADPETAHVPVIALTGLASLTIGDERLTDLPYTYLAYRNMPGGVLRRQLRVEVGAMSADVAAISERPMLFEDDRGRRVLVRAQGPAGGGWLNLTLQGRLESGPPQTASEGMGGNMDDTHHDSRFDRRVTEASRLVEPGVLLGAPELS